MLSKFALVLSLLCLLPTMAYAETSPPMKKQLFDLSIEELMRIKVASVSLFERDALTVGSTVSVIEPSDWQRQGARTTLEAIAHQPSTMLLPSLYGLNVVAIRGFSGVASARGIGTLLDGIPMNGPSFGSGQYVTQNIGLGVLDLAVADLVLKTLDEDNGGTRVKSFLP